MKGKVIVIGSGREFTELCSVEDLKRAINNLAEGEILVVTLDKHNNETGGDLGE